jgi:hypothetical protein
MTEGPRSEYVVQAPALAVHQYLGADPLKQVGPGEGRELAALIRTYNLGRAGTAAMRTRSPCQPDDGSQPRHSECGLVWVRAHAHLQMEAYGGVLTVLTPHRSSQQCAACGRVDAESCRSHPDSVRTARGASANADIIAAITIAARLSGARRTAVGPTLARRRGFGNSRL